MFAVDVENLSCRPCRLWRCRVVSSEESLDAIMASRTMRHPMKGSSKCDRVRVRIPCSTSNLGPGFDTLGLALNLYNEIHLERLTSSGLDFSSSIPGVDADGARLVLLQASRLFFRRARVKPFGFRISVSGDIPVARGLGSSTTARLGLIAGLNEMAGTGWSRGQLVDLAVELEGHPDNVSPSMYGGFVVATVQDRKVRHLRFRVSKRWKFVTLIPPFPMSTEAARGLLPESYPRADALHALNRAAFVVGAFASGTLESLKRVFDDRIHQPYRMKLIPELDRIIRAGERAGAIGGWLSGAGSGVMCLVDERPEAVARAMHRQLPSGAIKILTADNAGLRVLA